MSPTARRVALAAALAVLGVAAAVGIGLAANAISGDSIGLSADPLRAGERLAPAAAGRERRGEDRGTRRGAATQPERRAPAGDAEPSTTQAPSASGGASDDRGGDAGPGGSSDDRGGEASGGAGGDDASSGSGGDDGGGQGRGRGRGRGGDD
jgi:hypothetical protein